MVLNWLMRLAVFHHPIFLLHGIKDFLYRRQFRVLDLVFTQAPDQMTVTCGSHAESIVAHTVPFLKLGNLT